ncbi:hypothetical protein UlMin_012360 [Ulmus minor]
MNRPGDWNCRSCQHLNFQRHNSCQHCGDPKSSDFRGKGASSFGFMGSNVRPGDWYCCHSSCFKCGAFKDDGGFNCDMPRTRAFGVSIHNFTSKMECFRCNAPRHSF